MVRMVPEFSHSAAPCEWRSQHTSLLCHRIKTLRARKLFKVTIVPIPPISQISLVSVFATLHGWRHYPTMDGYPQKREAHPFTVLCLCNCVYLSLDIVTLTVLHLWEAPSVIWKKIKTRETKKTTVFAVVEIPPPPPSAKQPGWLTRNLLSQFLVSMNSR